MIPTDLDKQRRVLDLILTRPEFFGYEWVQRDLRFALRSDGLVKVARSAYAWIANQGGTRSRARRGARQPMDVVVTVPKKFGLAAWIAEGDAAGEEWSGEEWHFYLGGNPPKIERGERVYVLFNGKLRGYAPLVRIEREDAFRFALVRHAGAVAVTIDQYIKGFRGFRYRWWDYADEKPFPDWKIP